MTLPIRVLRQAQVAQLKMLAKVRAYMAKATINKILHSPPSDPYKLHNMCQLLSRDNEKL